MVLALLLNIFIILVFNVFLRFEMLLKGTTLKMINNVEWLIIYVNPCGDDTNILAYR